MVRVLYETACLGYPMACRNAALANALEYGPAANGGPHDFGSVRHFVDRVPTASRVPGGAGVDCNRFPFPCFAIAYGLAYPVRYQNVTTVSFDNALAARFAQASCTGSEMRGCNLLGKLIWQQRTTGWPPTAFSHFQNACRTGRLADACNNLGLAYEGGYGILANRTSAALNFQTACMTVGSDWPGGPSNGRAEGCYNLRRAFRDGISYGRNPVVARQHFTTACNLGHQVGCRASGSFSGGG